jgi:hypothetical protein
VETKSGVKPSEQRILCRGRLVSDETLLSNAPVENNDVLLMVRKAPQAAQTPPGLRNDPQAPHNRERRQAPPGAGANGAHQMRPLNIPGLPPNVQVVAGSYGSFPFNPAMMEGMGAHMLGSVSLTHSGGGVFNPADISRILSSMLGGASTGGGNPASQAQANAMRPQSAGRRQQPPPPNGSRPGNNTPAATTNTNNISNTTTTNTTTTASRRGRNAAPARANATAAANASAHAGLNMPSFPELFGSGSGGFSQVFETAGGPISVEFEMGPVFGMPGGGFSPHSPIVSPQQTATAVPPAAAAAANTNNTNNNNNRRNDPAQTLLTYANRVDQYLSTANVATQQDDDEHLPNVIHHGVACDLCDIMPIRGARFKCTNRDDYDLCSQCHQSTSAAEGGLQFRRLVFPLPVGLLNDALFSDGDGDDDDEEEDEEYFSADDDDEAAAGAHGGSRFTHEEIGSRNHNGITTSQADVDALTTALSVAARSAQLLIPTITQFSERVRSGEIFQSPPNVPTTAAATARSVQQRREIRDDAAQSAINGDILEMATQMHAIGALWTELARGISSVGPAALPASAFANPSSFPSARERNERSARRGSRGAAAMPTNAPSTAVGERRSQMPYTQNLSASRTFRLPQMAYLDQSSRGAFATVVPAHFSTPERIGGRTSHGGGDVLEEIRTVGWSPAPVSPHPLNGAVQGRPPANRSQRGLRRIATAGTETRAVGEVPPTANTNAAAPVGTLTRRSRSVPENNVENEGAEPAAKRRTRRRD